LEKFREKYERYAASVNQLRQTNYDITAFLYRAPEQGIVGY
jgi:hypothetical protein